MARVIARISTGSYTAVMPIVKTFGLTGGAVVARFGEKQERPVMTASLDQYIEACTYPGRMDEDAVNRALAAYLAALGVSRKAVRLRSGWTLDQYPELADHCRAVARAARNALDALAARDARAARAALAAQDALDALAALDALDALAARDARAARAALAAQDALDARAARAALAAQDADARDAREFARWCICAQSWFSAWDMSWLCTTAFGARQTGAWSVSAWSEPLLDAFINGCWRLIWTDGALYWVAKPRMHRDANSRLHCETGPALDVDDIPAYFWHGVLVPNEWITDRGSLTARTAITWPNIEQRRAACEIVGWHRILADLGGETVDAHPNPQVGSLVEVNIPDIGREKFLRVLCGTNREFALPVPPNMRTAIEAQAWTWGVDPSEFTIPEVRT